MRPSAVSSRSRVRCGGARKRLVFDTTHLWFNNFAPFTVVRNTNNTNNSEVIATKHHFFWHQDILLCLQSILGANESLRALYSAEYPVILSTDSVNDPCLQGSQSIKLSLPVALLPRYFEQNLHSLKRVSFSPSFQN